MRDRPTLDDEVIHWLRRTIGEAMGRVGVAAIAAATSRMLVGRLLNAPQLEMLEHTITSRWGVDLVIGSGNTVADVAQAIVTGMQRSAT